jgi:hypothetical protein
MKVNGQPTGRWLLLIIALIGTSLSCTEPTRSHPALGGPVDTRTIVRFFYVPPGPPEIRPHFPLVLQAVGEKDPRRGTAPVRDEGRTAYISLAEMREVVQILNDSLSSWDTSKDVRVPPSGLDLYFPAGMEIIVYFSTGTARTVITPSKLCTTLASIDVALRNRALWEFQLFRRGYDCTVSGFDREKYYKEHFLGDR